MHDNQNIVRFYAGHDGYGNVHICCSTFNNDETELVDTVSFTASPRVIEKFIGSMIAATIKAKSSMPPLKMSLQELPQSSEAHNGR